MAGTMVYRRQARAADAPDLEPFLVSMRAAQEKLDNQSFNHVAGHHGRPGWYCWHHQQSRRSPVQARLFLPWHRAYLWNLEQVLQDQDERAALPWWDWTEDRAIPDAYSRATVDGGSNPLRRYRIQLPATATRPAVRRYSTRSPGASPWGRLPTRADVDALLDDSDFASFSDRLQSHHDGVHVWVGGDMSDPTFAAFDPVFFAHHCMIDRIWYLWQVRWGIDRIPPALLDLALAPFGKTVRDVLDVQALGYEYAASSVAIPIP